MKRVAVTYSIPGKLPPYADAVREAGLEPVPNPPSLEGIDGLLLTGGADIDPGLYGETPHPETDEPNKDRDAMELTLLEQAIAARKPILAICRGLQLFNVHHRGSLHQHVPEHRVRLTDRSADAHSVEVLEGTRLAGIMGAGMHGVNSRHHQTVKIVGENLIVSANSSDGVVEGLERPDLPFAVAVQWHPEDRIRNSVADRKLFEAFAKALE